MAVTGDCGSIGLGLSASDRDLLIRDVSIVFNVAATVRFDEKIQDAVAINIRGPKEVLEIGRQMTKLKVKIIHFYHPKK